MLSTSSPAVTDCARNFCPSESQTMSHSVVIDGVPYIPSPAFTSVSDGDERARLLHALDHYRFNSQAGDMLTLRQYFCRIVEEVFIWGEGFSGKRPFGESLWFHELVNALRESGALLPEPPDAPKEDGDESAEFLVILQLIALMAEGS